MRRPTEPEAPSGAVAWVRGLRWPVVLVVVALLAFAAYRLTLRSAGEAVRGAGATVRQVGEQLGSVAERFRSGTITETFLAALPEIRSTGVGNLELATAEVTETLQRSDERRIFWDRVSLGETVSEIRVPVTYRYHLRLDDPWRIEVSGQTCVVHAPQIRPSLPPAIDTSRMTKRTDNGWLRFNAAQQLDELERSITPTLEAYASDSRHLTLVREQCRKTVAEFVRSWLLREEHWREDRFRSIVVLFPDERSAEGRLMRPSVELGR